jgi:hypothetical protein
MFWGEPSGQPPAAAPAPRLDAPLREPAQNEVARGVRPHQGGEAHEAPQGGVRVGGAGPLAPQVEGGLCSRDRQRAHLGPLLPLGGFGEGRAEGAEDGDSGGPDDAQRGALAARMLDAAEVHGEEGVLGRLLRRRLSHLCAAVPLAALAVLAVPVAGV